jgi:hypothetical protein
MRKQVIVVSLLTIYTMSEDWNHTLISVGIEMMNFVAFVQDISHHVGWGRIDDSRGDDIWHVSGILVLWYLELLVRVELADCSKVHVASENGNANGLCLGDMLEFFNEPVSFFLMVLGRPMIVQVIKNLDASIELVHKATKQTSTSHCLDRIHHPACEDVFEEVQPWVRNWDPKQNNQMLSLALNNLVFKTVKYDIIRVFSQDLITLSFGSTVQPKEGQLSSKVHEDAARTLFDVWSRTFTEYP